MNLYKWLRYHPRTTFDIARFLALLAVLASFIFLLNQISDQNKSRANNIDKLLRDNAQQTQVLCTLILSSKIDTSTFLAEDITRIEKICKERIKNQPTSVSAPTTPSSISVSVPQQPSKVFVSSSPSQSAPTNDNKQADTSQSQLPVVHDIVNLVSPLNKR